LKFSITHDIIMTVIVIFASMHFIVI